MLYADAIKSFAKNKCQKVRKIDKSTKISEKPQSGQIYQSPGLFRAKLPSLFFTYKISDVLLGLMQSVRNFFSLYLNLFV